MTTSNYFVDEAGDLNLFDKKGRIIIGQPGVSRFFMVGVAYLPDPFDVHRQLENLRAELLADPYFRNVPSLQPDNKKTAIAFHAKDDLPEVRREVFRLLPQFKARVQVVLRRKHRLAAEAQALFHYKRKLRADDIYDDLVMRLFRNLLHKSAENHIFFARRGKSERKEALESAIQKAKNNFRAKWGQRPDVPTLVQSAYPSQLAGLQVIDYYLWALQRCYETGEDRFFNLLTSDYKLIMDLDDKRNKGYGEWYSSKNALTIEKIKMSLMD